MSYISLLSLLTLVMVVYIVDIEINKLKDAIIKTKSEMEDSQLKIEHFRNIEHEEPYIEEQANGFVCDQIDTSTVKKTVRLEDIFTEYMDFTRHVRNVLNANQQLNGISVLDSVYDVAL